MFRRASTSPPPGSAGSCRHSLSRAARCRTRSSTRSCAIRTRCGRPSRRSPADPLADEDLQLALYLCYELHYRGLDGVAEEWEWEPSLLALRARLEARFEAGLLRGAGRARGQRPAGGDGHRAARHRGRGRRAVALQAPRARGHAGGAARVRRPPLRLPAQGGRPALVGAAAAQRRAEGRDGRDPGRRVRRRPRRPHPRAPVRQVDDRARARRDLRRLPRPHPGLHARHRQPDVAARPAPPLARRDRRPPGAVRDDLGGAQPPLRRRASGASAPATTSATSSTSTSPPTPSTSRSPRSTSPAAWPARSRS